MNEKQEFLYYYDMETQADLFSYLLYILHNIKKCEEIDFDDILFESSKRNGLLGYFSFPILEELIDKQIQPKSEEFLNEFKNNNKIDLESLFNFVVQKVHKKIKIYADFILNENIDFNILMNYFLARKNEKEKFPNVYKNSKLEEDLISNEIYRREYNKISKLLMEFNQKTKIL